MRHYIDYMDSEIFQFRFKGALQKTDFFNLMETEQ